MSFLLVAKRGHFLLPAGLPFCRRTLGPCSTLLSVNSTPTPSRARYHLFSVESLGSLPWASGTQRWAYLLLLSSVLQSSRQQCVRRSHRAIVISRRLFPAVICYSRQKAAVVSLRTGCVQQRELCGPTPQVHGQGGSQGHVRRGPSSRTRKKEA